ncbi:hypothetical protein GCM10009624_03530 [Gordonia sinesedis]
MTEMGDSERRLQRIMARFVGGGYVAYFLVSVPQFANGARAVEDWYTPVAVVCAFLPGFVLIAYSLRRELDQRVLTAIVWACAAGYFAACALWFVARDGRTTDSGQGIWLTNFVGVPALAVVIVSPLRVALLVLVILAYVVGCADEAAKSGTVAWVPVIQVFWAVAFSAMYVIATGIGLRTGRTLDETRRRAFAAAAATAGVAARETERARFDALIHDRVIATLVAASSGRDDPRLGAQARTALAELDAAAQPPDGTDMGPDEVVARLRATVTAVDDDTEVMVQRHGDPSVEEPNYPADVVAALGEALGEAVRNSGRHAGLDADRAVLLEIGEDAIRATAVDDGIGFDVGAVPPERLGIEVSVRQRMAALTGGGSRVHSEVGRGTTVQVWWTR